MLSKRLEAIYSLVEKNSQVADIGCDHGYLLIELYKNNVCSKLLGVDNKKGPLNSALSNLKKEKLDGKIKLSLSNGLKSVTDEYNTIVLAGLGSDTIIKVVNDDINKLNFIDTFIIDSHTDCPKIRHFFVNLGYFVDKEIILKEKNIIYTIIRFKKGDRIYNELEYIYGPYLLKNKSDEFINIYKEKLDYLTDLITKANNKEYFSKIEKEIEEIKYILNF